MPSFAKARTSCQLLGQWELLKTSENKQKIKEYLQKLDPKTLGTDKMSPTLIEKTGLGENNLNYLAIVRGKKYNIRINIETNRKV